MSKILFLGDLYYNFNVIESDIQKIIDYINENDLKCILNLESPLCVEESPILKVGPNLHQSSITIELLKKMNVIGVTLANNHMHDYGKESLMKTIEILDKNNIKHCGAGANIDEACAPMIFDDEKIMIFNSGWNVEETRYAKKNKWGCAPRKEKIMIKIFDKYKKDYFNIHILHWGFEYSIYPQPMDISLAHKLINKGSNLIIGHHPHIIQAYEEYKEVPIYYSLGNFYFSGRRDKFNKYIYQSEPKDRCNYGLGIIFDTELRQIIDRIVFYYNFELKETTILKEFNSNVLPIIDEKIVNSSNYFELIKRNRQNYNPIYANNLFLNFVYKLKLRLYRIWCLVGIKYPIIDKLKRKIKTIIKR